ncbi:unnamed protein product [Protopolystoma xenopodis]|uniref:Uncharacterized protein n=1 Tax=Protopolystoma xenopodis TaxID=117903 RepID=A0A448X9C7_9PLAT|nr:unnamed protein product [Protopolystoma xenopodis]
MNTPKVTTSAMSAYLPLSSVKVSYSGSSAYARK